MKIRQRSLQLGIALALAIALVVAIVPTFLDWRANPGGVFRGSTGTHWAPVMETIWSWFWPVFLMVVPFTVLIHAWIVHRRRDD